MRADVRVNEIASGVEIGTTYEQIDRAGDVAMETKLQRLFDLMDDSEEKQAAAEVYATWLKSERNEEVHVRGAVSEHVTLLRDNNDFWLSDGCGPDGRAA